MNNTSQPTPRYILIIVVLAFAGLVFGSGFFGSKALAFSWNIFSARSAPIANRSSCNRSYTYQVQNSIKKLDKEMRSLFCSSINNNDINSACALITQSKNSLQSFINSCKYPSPTPTFSVTPTISPKKGLPFISFIEPINGLSGTRVVVHGENFLSIGNAIKIDKFFFNNTFNSPDGKTLAINIPYALSACNPLTDQACIQIAVGLEHKSYDLYVVNANGTSNPVIFTFGNEIRVQNKH